MRFSTITTKTTRHLSHPPIQQTRQPSIRGVAKLMAAKAVCSCRKSHCTWWSRGRKCQALVTDFLNVALRRDLDQPGIGNVRRAVSVPIWAERPRVVGIRVVRDVQFQDVEKNVALIVDSSTTPLQRFHPVNKYTLFPVILTCSVICMKPDQSRVVTELRDSAYDLHSSPFLKGDRKPCDSL
jgi:hypothetical protein